MKPSENCERAKRALKAYQAGLELEEAVSDLVTDLRTLAEREGIDWIKVVDLAEIHFEDERDA